MGFFTHRPEFFDPGRPLPDRCNARYVALVESNLQNIKDKRILDLGSFNGLWTFAALKAGAKFVCGVEGRPENIKYAENIFEKNKISSKTYEFICGDVIDCLKQFSPKEFDTIFCFGILYHVMNHLDFLHAMKSLKPQLLIIDTLIHRSKEPSLYIREEPPNWLSGGVSVGDHQKDALVGIPSRPALELMLHYVGFEWEYYPWRKKRTDNWEGIGDYFEGTQVTLLARAIDPSP